MAGKKEPFYEPQKRTAQSTSEDIDLGRVLSGWLFCYQRVAFENETSGGTNTRIRTMQNELVFEHSEQLSPVADRLYWDDMPIYIKEGDYLRISFAGVTADDVLSVYASGWKQKIGRGE